ncbi:ubiquitin-associated protein 1-like [Clavelina lepadiformis]|uniref:ubiquitin-associated protein 1-like n=1 Tax=Clavelina lepadiformis TaxID=159417 RepID=UPI0040432BC4
MSSSNVLSLDGVIFKLADAILVHRKIELPYDFDLKDPEVILDDCEYDFSLEKNVIARHQAKEQRLEEEKQRELKRKQRQKEELAEKHRKFLQEKERKKQFENPNPKNPFYNNMTSSNILTPQPVHQNLDNSDDPPALGQLDVHEFENNDQDPFSNMELKSIDDLKELKDVLQHVTKSSAIVEPTPATVTHPVPRIRQHSPTVTEEVSVKITKRSKNDPALAKSSLVNELTDLLTDDVQYTMEEDTVSTENLSSASANVLPQYFTSNAPDSEMPTARSSPSPTVLNGANVSSRKTSSPSFLQVEQSNSQTVIHSSKGIHTENTYVNVKIPQLEKPKVKPRTIASKAKLNNTDSKDKEKLPSTTSYEAVRSKVLANKSAEERARFEETINKALSSLPQLPSNVIKQPLAPGNSSSHVPTNYQAVPLSPGIICGLAPDEREFAQAFISMGFKEEDVIRTMQKYGKDHKEVIDHLCILQRLSEEGFSTDDIEDALEVFNGKEEEAKPFLTLQQQFLAMGFPSKKVKQALLLHNQDQTKSLEELMNGS